VLCAYEHLSKNKLQLVDKKPKAPTRFKIKGQRFFEKLVPFILRKNDPQELALNKAKYFYRILLYTIENGQVALVDKHDPDKTIPLEPWLGLVISLADGKHTIAQLIDHVESSYKGVPPAGLEKTLESAIDRLVKSQALQLADEVVTLPYYLTLPKELLDKEKAYQLMIEDGFIKH